MDMHSLRSYRTVSDLGINSCIYIISDVAELIQTQEFVYAHTLSQMLQL